MVNCEDYRYYIVVQEYPLHCPLCGQPADSKVALGTHLEKAHGIKDRRERIDLLIKSNILIHKEQAREELLAHRENGGEIRVP